MLALQYQHFIISYYHKQIHKLAWWRALTTDGEGERQVPGCTQHPLVAQTAERYNMLHPFLLPVMACTDKLAAVQRESRPWT